MSRKKENKVVKITTNKLVYDIDYDKFRERYRIFRYRMMNDNCWLSAYDVSLSLPADKVRVVYDSLTGDVKNPVELYEFPVEKDEKKDRIILNLLLNTCVLGDNQTRSHRDYGKLLLVRADSFNLKNLRNDKVALELQVNKDFVLTASSVTFKRVCPGKNEEQVIENQQEADDEDDVEGDSKKEKKGPDQYYSFDHLEMTIHRELPDDWVKRFKDGTMTFYVRGTSNPRTRHVVEQLNLADTKLYVGKTAVLYQVVNSLSTNYADIFRSVRFNEIEKTVKLEADYEKKAKGIMKSVSDSLSYRIEDTVMSDESRLMIRNIKEKSDELKLEKKDILPFLRYSEAEEADCIIRLVHPAKEMKGKEDSYHELNRLGRVVQHMEVKKDYRSDAILKAALGRIMKELTVKRILSKGSIEGIPGLESMKGWSFAVCKKVDDDKYIGLSMHMSADGNISFARLDHPVDMPGGEGRMHMNMLSNCRSRIENKFGIDKYPSQETYYMLSKNNNIYHIVYSSEQALPEFDALRQYYKMIREWPTVGGEEVMDIMESIVTDDPEVLEKIEEKNEYTVDEIRRMARKLKKSHPQVSSKLYGLVDDMPYTDQIRRKDHVDKYFGGLVDIHVWSGQDNALKYISAEKRTNLNIVNSLSYNSFPHVRTLHPFAINDRNNFEDDYEAIFDMLQTGFGKAHYGTALPFGFKLLKEMCDILCLEQFGIHWNQMNAKQYKIWQGRFYAGLGLINELRANKDVTE